MHLEGTMRSTLFTAAAVGAMLLGANTALAADIEQPAPVERAPRVRAPQPVQEAAPEPAPPAAEPAPEAAQPANWTGPHAGAGGGGASALTSGSTLAQASELEVD